MITEITNDNYTDFISGEDLTVIKIGAEWCGPCRVVSPILEKISNDIDINIGEIDSDEQSELVRVLSIRSVPTTLFFKKGIELKRLVGAFSEDSLKSLIDETRNMKVQ